LPGIRSPFPSPFLLLSSDNILKCGIPFPFKASPPEAVCLLKEDSPFFPFLLYPLLAALGMLITTTRRVLAFATLFHCLIVSGTSPLPSIRTYVVSICLLGDQKPFFPSLFGPYLFYSVLRRLMAHVLEVPSSLFPSLPPLGRIPTFPFPLPRFPFSLDFRMRFLVSRSFMNGTSGFDKSRSTFQTLSSQIPPLGEIQFCPILVPVLL